MSTTATLAWFAQHECRLAWRDWLAMMTAGKRGRGRVVAAVLVVFIACMHLLAYSMVGRYATMGHHPDKAALVVVSGSVLLSFSLMLSQAMESVTRAFYARVLLRCPASPPKTSCACFAIYIAPLSGDSAYAPL